MRRTLGGMIWVDYTFIAIVFASLLIGAFRGLIRECLSLATWILAFVLTLRYGPEVADRLKASIGTESLRLIAGYALCFFGVLLAGALLTLLVSLLIRGSGLGGVDRMLGAGFGLLRGLFVIVAIVMVVGVTEARNEAWWKHSVLVPALIPAAAQLQALIPESWLSYLRPQVLPPVRKSSDPPAVFRPR